MEKEQYHSVLEQVILSKLIDQLMKLLMNSCKMKTEEIRETSKASLWNTISKFINMI